MEEKTIAKVLSKKFNDWVSNITDEKVRSLVERNTIITGGCISSLRMGLPVNDYDVYFTNKETTKEVAKYYVDLFNKKHNKKENKLGYAHRAMVLDGDENIEEQVKSYGEEVWPTRMLEVDPGRIKIVVRSDGVTEDKEYISDIELDEVGDLTLHNEPNIDPQEIMDEGDETVSEEELENLVKNDGKDDSSYPKKFKPIFLSTNAVTLSGKMQCIIRFYGTPEEIHSNFDFVHVMGYWESKNQNKVVIPLDTLNAMVDKKLLYRGSKYPLATMVRVRKYLKRGWSINAGQLLKIAYQLHDINLYDVKVLEDQLVGVDTMYFKMFLDIIQKEKGDTAELDQDYVVSVIEKVFG